MQSTWGNSPFDTSEILYHGTTEAFHRFDCRKAITARHIYTTPDLGTARTYGPVVCVMFGRQQPQADLRVDRLDPTLIRNIHRVGRFEQDWDMSPEDVLNRVTSGLMYDHHRGYFQDDVCDACFDLGFRSVRFLDKDNDGHFSDSVVFQDPRDLRIMGRMSRGTGRSE